MCDPVSVGSISFVTILYKYHVNVIRIVIVWEVTKACRWFYLAVKDVESWRHIVRILVNAKEELILKGFKEATLSCYIGALNKGNGYKVDDDNNHPDDVTIHTIDEEDPHNYDD